MLKLRLFREARGWSRAELARQARLNACTLGQIENGRFKPYPVQLGRIADALGHRGEPAELLEEV